VFDNYFNLFEFKN